MIDFRFISYPLFDEMLLQYYRNLFDEFVEKGPKYAKMNPYERDDDLVSLPTLPSQRGRLQMPQSLDPMALNNWDKELI